MRVLGRRDRLVRDPGDRLVPPRYLLVKYSYAFVALPGGFGTLDEMFEVATLVQTGKIRGFPIVLIGREFWKPLLEFVRSRLVAEQAVAPETPRDFW